MADEDTLVQYTDEHADGTIERVFIRHTDDEADYPSGWRYSLHYGTKEGETIVRYDNAHEATKGHERHAGEQVTTIDFPGMMELYDRFLTEIDRHRR
ncbi:toxin-antitoxin system TumE family protein [Halorussus litoreus]|uniref:toxin-antitoxin system TumE family protein n=1 Tax=Halorussus litoreus TaxID=1710536 RepID=UPI0018E50644|nr:DUF6516 family protein [Halorussus litoreus]